LKNGFTVCTGRGEGEDALATAAEDGGGTRLLQ